MCRKALSKGFPPALNPIFPVISAHSSVSALTAALHFRNSAEVNWMVEPGPVCSMLIPEKEHFVRSDRSIVLSSHVSGYCVYQERNAYIVSRV